MNICQSCLEPLIESDEQCKFVWSWYISVCHDYDPDVDPPLKNTFFVRLCLLCLERITGIITEEISL